MMDVPESVIGPLILESPLLLTCVRWLIATFRNDVRLRVTAAGRLMPGRSSVVAFPFTPAAGKFNVIDPPAGAAACLEIRNAVRPAACASTEILPENPELSPVRMNVPAPAAALWRERVLPALPIRFPEIVMAAAVALLWEIEAPPV